MTAPRNFACHDGKIIAISRAGGGGGGVGISALVFISILQSVIVVYEECLEVQFLGSVLIFVTVHT